MESRRVLLFVRMIHLPLRRNDLLGQRMNLLMLVVVLLEAVLTAKVRWCHT